MAQISYTHTKTALPDSAISGALAKDGDLSFPQQVSFFYAGKIADGLGAFVQLTYDGNEDHFGFDNTDIRYAHHLSFGGANDNNHDMILGVTLNNNPTVQDVWNTTPAWGFPYAASSSAPGTPRRRRSTAAAGGFGQTVGGLGVYVWLDDHFYAEISDYTSAIPGGAHPLGQHANERGARIGALLAPGLRAALGPQFLVGRRLRLDCERPPGERQRALAGATDKFKDTAVDVQYQFIGEEHLLRHSWGRTSTSTKRSMPAFWLGWRPIPGTISRRSS